MSSHGSRLLFTIARRRVVVSRIFGVVVLFLALFTTHSFSQDNPIDIIFEALGLFLLTICSMGRLWSLLYISGYKRRELIKEGPYSMVRHPLYVFSLIGAIGIGVASENILVLGVLVIFYLLYYPLAILVEEKRLVDKFGQAYLDYVKSTPRFLPKLSLYKSPSQIMVNSDIFVRNLASGMWFIWIFIALHFIETLQENGCIPVVLRVP